MGSRSVLPKRLSPTQKKQILERKKACLALRDDRQAEEVMAKMHIPTAEEILLKSAPKKSQQAYEKAWNDFQVVKIILCTFNV